MSGSVDGTLSLCRKSSDQDRSSIFDTPIQIAEDVCSFLTKSSYGVLSPQTVKHLQKSDQRFSLRSSVLQLAIVQLENFRTKSAEQQVMFTQKHAELQREVEERTPIVSDQARQVEILEKQLDEAKKQLTTSQQALESFKDEEKECAKKLRVSTDRADKIKECCDLYKGELDKTRSALHLLSKKLQENHSVSCLSQEEVLLLLQELDFPSEDRELFQRNKIGGTALELVSDRNLRELGIRDIMSRKVLLHSIYNVLVYGCIRVVPPPAWWNAEKAWKWLEKQGCSFSCLKGLTGQTLLHLSDEDISKFDLPMGSALELLSKCETLKKSAVMPISAARSQDSPHEFVCPISKEIMKNPVIAADGCFFFFFYPFSSFIFFSYLFTGLSMRNSAYLNGYNSTTHPL